jgi:hypothetical protein
MVHPKERAVYLMKRIVDGWSKRAKIRHNFIDFSFAEEKDDFLESLLPFHHHPKYHELDHQQKRSCLSYGWIIYNEKTLMIESEVVNPACKTIMEGRVPGLKTNEARLAACETMIDEAYHMLIVEQANQITKIHRNLQPVVFPQFHLAKSIEQAYRDCDKSWMKPLLQMATATVTEVLISDYLSTLSNCYTIQPMNRITVATHLHDELAHSSLFSSMLHQLYGLLPSKQQNFFSKSISHAVNWFKNNELDLWESVLNQIGIPHSKEIIGDLKAANLQSIVIDSTDLMTLLEMNGIMENNYSQDLFAVNS